MITTNTIEGISIDQARVKAWCVEMLTLYAEHGKPIRDTSDPRAEAIVAHRLFEHTLTDLETMDEWLRPDGVLDIGVARVLGSDYFRRIFHEKPEIPIDLPEWAAGADLSEFVWDGLFAIVTLRSIDHGASDVSVVWDLDLRIDLETGGVESLGPRSMLAMIKNSRESIELDDEHAVALADALRRAVATSDERSVRRPAGATDHLADLDG